MKQWRTWYRSRSLRRHLLWWLLTVHLAAAIGTAWFSYSSYGGMVHAFMDEQMHVLADSYAGNTGTPQVQPVSPASVARHGAFIIQIWSPDGQRLQASSLPDVGVPLQGAPGLHDVRTGERRADLWRVYTAAVDPRAGVAEADAPRVQVVQSADARRREIKRRALLAALPILLMLPASLVFLGCVVWANSRILRQVADDIAAQDERTLTEIPLSRLPEEVAPLLVAFNTLLARMREAFDTRRRFVQDAAHELRTPMAAIGLQMENFRACVPHGLPAERFQQVEAGVRRAQRLIEQLLRLSRQDAPGTDPAVFGAVAETDIAQLLRQSIEPLMVLADRRRIDLGFDGAVGISVRANAHQLRSLFDNLIDNALRYASEGGVVDVRLHAPGGHPVVDVVDNGPGIAPEYRARAFDRFFRVPGTGPDGSGLGLAIAQAAAQRNGMRVELLDREDGRPGLLARVWLLV